VHIYAPDVGLWNVDESYVFGYVAVPRNFSYLASTAIETDREGGKVNYISPPVYGFQIAGSYMSGGWTGDGGDDYADFDGGYAASVIYKEDGGFGITASVAGFSDTDIHGVSHARRRREYSVGSKYYWRGFQVAAAYRRVLEDDSTGARSNAGYAADGGFAYELGPLELSLTHHYSNAAGDVANPGRDVANLTILSGKYSFVEDVSAMLAVGRAAYDLQGAGARVGTMTAAGLMLAF
jgi:hypothetical protein